jgi:hypothetical protein
MTEAPRNEVELAEARGRAKVHLLPTDLYRDETVAFDVVVDGMGLVGRWSQTRGYGGMVVWTTGESYETGSCDLDSEKIIAAVRESIPYRMAEGRQPAARRILGQILRGGGSD